jgi:hypothetical protein
MDMDIDEERQVLWEKGKEQGWHALSAEELLFVLPRARMEGDLQAIQIVLTVKKQEELIKQTKYLVYATWFLAIVAIITGVIAALH